VVEKVENKREDKSHYREITGDTSGESGLQVTWGHRILWTHTYRLEVDIDKSQPNGFFSLIIYLQCGHYFFSTHTEIDTQSLDCPSSLTEPYLSSTLGVAARWHCVRRRILWRCYNLVVIHSTCP